MSWFKKIFSKTKKNIKLVMIGLDNAGKTSILNYLKSGEMTQTIPTMGVNYESVKFKNLTFNCYDIGGQTAFRQFWGEAVQDCNALLFVVDSADRERIEESKKEIIQIIKEFLPPSVPILIIANKNDIEGHLTEAEIARIFEMPELKEKTWHVQETSVKTGYGLVEAFIWLYEQLTGKKLKIPFSFTELIIFDTNGIPLLNKSKVLKESTLISGFLSAINSFLKELIHKKLDAIIVEDYKFIFIHRKNFIATIIIKFNESESVVRKTLQELCNLIEWKDLDEIEQIFNKFIMEHIK
ncbi:MAG: ADP-ribosylation factor family protein [Candidatus Helarchaeota archaeon]